MSKEERSWFEFLLITEEDQDRGGYEKEGFKHEELSCEIDLILEVHKIKDLFLRRHISKSNLMGNLKDALIKYKK
jgi:hypothetical protein